MKYYFNEDFFNQDSEESFYWAGFIAADGCLYIKKSKYSNLPTVELVCSIKDLEHLEKFRSHIDCEKRIYIKKNGKSKINNNDLFTCRLQLHSNKLFSNLKDRFNIHQSKTKNHQFPINIKDHILINHFLRGYFDGDGGFYNQHSGRLNPQMSIRICGTLDFLNEYKIILESKAKVKSKSVPYMYNGQGALNYSGNKLVTNLVNVLYSDQSVCLDRKLKQAKEIYIKK